MAFKVFKIYASRLITLSQTLLDFGRQWQKRPAVSWPIEGKTMGFGKGHAWQQRPVYLVFSRLHPFSLQPPRHMFGSTGHLSTNTVYPYDGRGFVGTKKKPIVGLLVFSPLWDKELAESLMMTFAHCSPGNLFYGD
jgi:hypothetical protein